MRFSIANLSLRSKIVGGFVLVLCLTCALGLFAMRQLSAVSVAADDMRDHWLPSTRLLGQISSQVTRYRQREALMVMASEDAKASEKADLIANRADVETSFASYAPLLQPGSEQSQYNEVRRLWQAYLVLSEKFFTLAAAGNNVDAVNSYRGDMRSAFKAFLAAVDADLDWHVSEGKRVAEAGEALEEQTRTLLMIGMAVTALCCFGIGWLLVRSIAAPVAAMTAAMSKLAAGDHAVDIPGRNRRDEIGAMAASVQSFKDAAIAKLDLETAAEQHRKTAEDERSKTESARAEATQAQNQVVSALANGLKALSNGDLTAQIEAEFSADYEELRANYNRAVGQLHTLVSSIVGNASTIRSGTGEIAQAADDLARRTEQQAASLEQTAAALAEITNTVNRTAQGAKHAGEVVAKAKADAGQSGAVVRDTVAAMGEIEQSAKQISQIIGVIDEIAFQTNLLALNAGVEAARAGDAGRGFAVVASEVRALAQRSAEAAKEIKGLISASTQQVGRGVELVGETGRALGRIVNQVEEISGVVAEIAGAAQDQATGLREVSTAVNQMDQVTQQNAAMVEESTAASHAVAQETVRLAAMTEQFRLGDAPANTAAASPARRATPRSATRKPALKLVAHGEVPVAADEGWAEF